MVGTSLALRVPRVALLGMHLALWSAKPVRQGASLAACVPRVALEGANRVASGLPLARQCAKRKLVVARRRERPLRPVLRDARLALSMSQAEFGAALGWSQRTAFRWERDKSTPTDELLAKLTSLLAPLDLGLAAELAVVAEKVFMPRPFRNG